MSEELDRREVGESLMRSHGVVSLFPGPEFAVQFGEGERKRGDPIEFLGMRAIGALDLAVEFGGAGWQEKEPDAALLASLLEAGGGLHVWGVTMRLST